MSEIDDNENTGVLVKLARQRVIEAKTRYEQAYAKAYIESVEEASILFGISKAKVTKEIMKQVAINNASVKEAREDLNKASRKLIETQEEFEKYTEELSLTERADEALAKITLPEFGENALDVLEAIRLEVDVVEDNINQITENINKHNVQNRSDWVEEIQENATVYKVDLSHYLNLLRKIQRTITNKQAIWEIKAEIDRVKNMRDDCKSLIDLARTQSWV